MDDIVKKLNAQGIKAEVVGKIHDETMIEIAEELKQQYLDTYPKVKDAIESIKRNRNLNLNRRHIGGGVISEYTYWVQG